MRALTIATLAIIVAGGAMIIHQYNQYTMEQEVSKYMRELGATKRKLEGSERKPEGNEKRLWRNKSELVMTKRKPEVNEDDPLATLVDRMGPEQKAVFARNTYEQIKTNPDKYARAFRQSIKDNFRLQHGNPQEAYSDCLADVLLPWLYSLSPKEIVTQYLNEPELYMPVEVFGCQSKWEVFR